MHRYCFHCLTSLACLTCLVIACSGETPADTETTDSDTEDTSSGTTQGPTTDGTSTDPSTTTLPTSTSEDPTTGSTSTTNETSETTGPAPDCVAADGEPDEACDPDTPFCLAGSCVTCSATGDGNASCAALDSAVPVCETGSGVCVECTPEADDECGGQTPICDELTYTCDACTEHYQCGTTACNLETGICFDENNVLYVDGAAADCDMADGSEALPFCTIQEAFDQAMMVNQLASWTIWIAPGTYTQASLISPMGSKLAMLASGGPVSIVSTANMQNVGQFEIGTNSTVFLSGISLSSHPSWHGLVCQSGIAYIDDTTLSFNKRYGVYSVDCTLYMRRTVAYENMNGGIVITGVNADDDPMSTFENVYISDNGSPQSAFGGVQLSDNHNLRISYSTIVNNLAMNGGVSSVQCVNPGSVEIRNSAVIAFTGTSFACGEAVINNSAVDDLVDNGMNNIMAMPVDIQSWFGSGDQGIYEAEPGSPLMDLATWSDGDPRTDFNGDLRPMVDGTSDWAGADVPN